MTGRRCHPQPSGQVLHRSGYKCSQYVLLGPSCRPQALLPSGQPNTDLNTLKLNEAGESSKTTSPLSVVAVSLKHLLSIVKLSALTLTTVWAQTFWCQNNLYLNKSTTLYVYSPPYPSWWLVWVWRAGHHDISAWDLTRNVALFQVSPARSEWSWLLNSSQVEGSGGGLIISAIHS